MFNFKVHRGEYERLLWRVKLDGTRKCTDSLCCFFPRESDANILLVKTSFAKRGTDSFEVKYACRHLKFDYKDENGVLVLKGFCSSYEQRPAVCREYSLQPTCTFNFYMAHRDLWLYAFDREKFPGLDKFNAGLLGIGERKFCLIPIPLEKKAGITCSPGHQRGAPFPSSSHHRTCLSQHPPGGGRATSLLSSSR